MMIKTLTARFAVSLAYHTLFRFSMAFYLSLFVTRSVRLRSIFSSCSFPRNNGMYLCSIDKYELKILNQQRFFISDSLSLSLSTLTSVSSIDGRYASTTAALRPYFSEYGLIKNRVIVELKWLKVLVKLQPFIVSFPIKKDELSADSNAFIDGLISNFGVNDASLVKQIERTTNHDVKAVEYFIKQKFEESKNTELFALSEWIHFGCTSEDINNLSYGLLLKEALSEVIFPNMERLILTLKATASLTADVSMLSRTHGQTATPSTIGREIAVFAHRLERQFLALKQIKILGKLNGAVGNYNALVAALPAVDWELVSKDFIETDLKLTQNRYTTQIEPHDFLAEIFDCISRFNTVLLDMNRDMWGYISAGYFAQKAIAGEIGSSTMPHKINPIDFENSEGNIGMANALFGHFSSKLPVSRFQRDLSDSTVLRSMGVAMSYSVIAYSSTLKGLSKLEVNKVKIDADLDHAWEVLAEPVQTVMRALGIPEPYEKLKAFTRGRTITKSAMREFIESLDIPAVEKNRLLDLTPHNYLGVASSLAKSV